MRIQLLGKNKLGIVDGSWKKEDFGADLGHQLDRCNAIVQGWIMSSVTPELHTGIVYASSAREVWKDLRERFDKLNASRIYHLHKNIATTVQGNDTIPSYFSRLRNLWDEFASIIPHPCYCFGSKDFSLHLKRQKLMQFLMGLNETYDQSCSQILMIEPIPTINKAYAMLIERESQRSIGSSSISGDGTYMAALMAGKRMHNNVDFGAHAQRRECLIVIAMVPLRIIIKRRRIRT